MHNTALAAMGMTVEDRLAKAARWTPWTLPEMTGHPIPAMIPAW